MTGCYLTSLPFEFMRSTADFDPDWSGSYFLPRDTVKPPFALRTRIWPSLDEWKYAHDAGSSSVEANKAAGAFLELLDWFRDVLLQDAVFLQKPYPRHPLFQDPVFQGPQFAALCAASRERLPRGRGRQLCGHYRSSHPRRRRETTCPFEPTNCREPMDRKGVC
jgi:hypothetical protein